MSTRCSTMWAAISYLNPAQRESPKLNCKDWQKLFWSSRTEKWNESHQACIKAVRIACIELGHTVRGQVPAQVDV